MNVLYSLIGLLAVSASTLGPVAAGNLVPGSSESKTVKLVIKRDDTGITRLQAFGDSGTSAGSDYEVVEVPADEADATAALLLQQEGVLKVERDLPTAIPTPLPPTPVAPNAMVYAQSVDGAPNDPLYTQQYHWLAQTDLYRGQSGFVSAYKRGVRNHEVNVAVLDGGFADHPELSWAGGYNFTSDGSAESDYLDYDATECDNWHGQVVGSIIGAEANNAQSIAGMVDAGLYAIRVLGCEGTGSLMEAARGVRYAAGDASLDVPVIGVKMDVINLSLGAKGSCPDYMQSAIDFARSKGITVIVAAGNGQTDAGGFTPANCQGVVTVGAVDQQGNQAEFSNFGTAVDISLAGVKVVAPNQAGGHSHYSGTSFSAPVAAGMVAHLRQQKRTISPDEVESMLKASTTAFGATTNHMGAGITNGRKLQDLYESTVTGRGASLKHVLDADDRCDDTLYLDYYQGLFDVCGLYEVSVGELQLVAGKQYALFAVPLGAAMTVSEDNLIGAWESTRFIVPDVDSSVYQYGIQVCAADGTACEKQNIIKLDTSGLTRPASCEDTSDGLAQTSSMSVRRGLG